MIELRGLDSLNSDTPSVVSVGTFDGVHLGHQQLIRRLKELARELGAKATLITFEPHPQLVLSSPNRPSIKLLTPLAEKRELIAELGADRLVVVDFTPEFAAIPPAQFVEEVLVRRARCRGVVAGADHSFGHGREGSLATLRALGERFGFKVVEVPEVLIDGEEVSSTAIRRMLLREGDVSKAARFLGRLYEVRGTVGRGEGRGRSLGFPTANVVLETPHKLLPRDGIYAGFAVVRGRQLPAAINVGVRPTFNGSHRVVEAHIVSEVGDLYGTPIRVLFVERIRDEVAFPSVGELVAQMEDDVRKTLRILQEYRRSLVEEEEK
ncbi:MAG: bifunctional riboflavin kinase/FAD synthetase [candidate division KSB1 bacterium]|nr:bifunctional riboflavin kinase/FAD synthetase [candidate division KSB1 bacterium]